MFAQREAPLSWHTPAPKRRTLSPPRPPPRSLANDSHLNYDDPNAYVEDRKAKEKGGAKARAPAPSKKPKATPKAEL